MTIELQKFIDFDWDYLSQLKNESLIVLKKNYAIASMIEYKKSLDPNVACNLPFGFQYRPKSIERQIEQLINEVQNLEKNTSSTIAQASELITEINLAVNPEERLGVQQEYGDFITKNSLEDTTSAEGEWQNLQSNLATLWKEFDRPECYAGFKQADLPDVADKLLNGENISDILHGWPYIIR